MRYWVLLLLSILALGCSKSHSDYKPSPTAARDALAAGLTAWSQGKPAGELPAAAAGQPRIHFADFQWSSGKRLQSFKLLEDTPTLKDSTQVFKVHLELAGEKPQDAEYYVVGIDPLWVMRDRDYRQTSME
jgi:hypothetical protein